MIRLLVLDVDGTLSDGMLYFDENGGEMKCFCVKDGLALSSWHKLGHKSAIITGRSSKIVERRAHELGIEFLFQGVQDKGAKVREIAERLKLSKEQIAGIGDDLNDLKMFAEVGMSFAPKDCAKLVANRVDVLLDSCGGKGAVREMIENILERNGELDALLALWE